jgi:ribose-phosphate pyrophosphokinase
MGLRAMREIGLFALGGSRDFGERIAVQLGIALDDHEERAFEDGEHKARPLVSVRGRDVFVVHSLYGDADQSPNDKLCKLLFFIGALRDASAARVTAVVPYLAYARKDRKTQTRDPVTTRYVAQLLEAAGTDRILSIDVHNLAAFQNAFRCPADHLEARSLLARHFADVLGDEPVVVLSPDVGGMKRAEAFRETLAGALGRDLELGFMEKKREHGKVSGETLFAQVEGRAVVIIDDLISARLSRSGCDPRLRRCHARPVRRRRARGGGDAEPGENRGHRHGAAFPPRPRPGRAEARRAVRGPSVRRCDQGDPRRWLDRRAARRVSRRSRRQRAMPRSRAASSR